MITISDHAEHIDLFLAGGGLTWMIAAAVSTMPPYSGKNYFIKWLYAFLHLVSAKLDQLHIPGSPADIAAAPLTPPSKPEEK